MHLKEIVLDGFKSYAVRTVVSGFDPEFNAITGLNGSGKSNILDSICFVLGISNLTQVRPAPPTPGAPRARPRRHRHRLIVNGVSHGRAALRACRRPRRGSLRRGRWLAASDGRQQ